MVALTPTPDRQILAHKINQSKALRPADISDEDWDRQLTWVELFKMYPPRCGIPQAKIKASVKKATGQSLRTFFRHRRTYFETGKVSAIGVRKSCGGRGKSRIHPETEKIVQKVLKKHRKNRRFRVKAAILDIHLKCREAGVPFPSKSLVYNRASLVGDYHSAKDAGLARSTLASLDATPGSAPKFTTLLERVQIDHTLVNTVCVSRFIFDGEEITVAVGRPWITMAVCESSHMVIGLSLSFEPPSSASLAHFVSHMIFPKQELLAEHQLNHQWPCNGTPSIIYTDNGSDFTARAFIRGCEEIGISPEFRPVGGPRYGGQIERYIGLAMGSVELCDGATAATWAKAKRTWNPGEEASITIDALEKRLLIWVLGQYHKQPKKALNYRTPLRMWEHMYGKSLVSKARTQLLPSSRSDCLINFLTPDTRVIDNAGLVNMYGEQYYSESIRHLRRTGSKKSYHTRSSKHDISKIWLRDPESNEYHALTAESIPKGTSYQELNESRRALKAANIDPRDYNAILDAQEEINLLDQQERSKSKATKVRKGTKLAKRKRREDIARRSKKDAGPPSGALKDQDKENILEFKPLKRTGRNKSARIIQRIK